MPGRAELAYASNNLHTQMHAQLHSRLTRELWRHVLLTTTTQYALDSPAGLRRR